MFISCLGYVLSKNALRTFVEKVLKNKKLCPQIAKDKLSEDWNVPLCLEKLNVYAGDGRDLLKRERFFVYKPESNLFAKADPWYKNRLYYFKRMYHLKDWTANDCCSNYSISFHYIFPRYMYTLYYFSYILKPYGIKFRYPLPPKLIFSDVVRTLQMERRNVSYRGY